VVKQEQSKELVVSKLKEFADRLSSEEPGVAVVLITIKPGVPPDYSAAGIWDAPLIGLLEKFKFWVLFETH
jgi:hypothetical protein